MSWGEQYRAGLAQDRKAALTSVWMMSQLGFATSEMYECLEALSLIPDTENVTDRHRAANRDMPVEIGGPACSPRGEPTRSWVD